METGPLGLEKLSLSPKPETNSESPLPSFSSANDPDATGDGSKTLATIGEGDAHSDVKTEKVTGPAQNDEAPVAATTAASEHKANDHKIKEESPALSDENQEITLSPRVDKSGKVITAHTPASDIKSRVQKVKEEELEKSLDIQKKIREGEFSYDIFVAIKKQLKAHGPGKTLSSEDTIERICMMARYPFTIEPGDWLITRPRSLNERKPPPLCR